MKKKKARYVSDIILPTDYSLEVDGITQSLLSIFPICRQRFLFKVNRWQKIGNDLNPLFGNINHDVFDKVYTLGRKPSKKLIKRCIDNYCSEQESKLSATALEYLEQESALSELILEEYFNFYEKDFEKMCFIDVEKVFEVEFHGFKLKGKTDGKFMSLPKVICTWLIEHKNKGRIETDLIEGVLNFDFQNLFYINADHIEYGWKELSRVLYNIIRHPYKKQKTPLDKFLKRVKEEIQKDPEHYFIRYQTIYTEKTINEFKEELYYILNETEGFLKGKIPCYKNRLACKMPYKCEFLDACSSGNMIGYIQQDSLFPELAV